MFQQILKHLSPILEAVSLGLTRLMPGQWSPKLFLALYFKHYENLKLCPIMLDDRGKKKTLVLEDALPFLGQHLMGLSGKKKKKPLTN